MSNSKIIPKSNAGAVRSWLPATLGQSGTASAAEQPADAPAKAKARIAAELDQLRIRAREEGHTEGYRAGIARAEGEIEAMRALMNSFEATRTAIEQGVAQQVLALALDVAKQMVRTSIAAKPELLLQVIAEAIKTFPELEQGARLVLHPEDAALVRRIAADESQSAIRGWSIVEDAAMTRGGCRIQTTATDIDASIGNRWRRVVAALGSDDAWVERDS